jgi:hypothetical protein
MRRARDRARVRHERAAGGPPTRPGRKALAATLIGVAASAPHDLAAQGSAPPAGVVVQGTPSPVPGYDITSSGGDRTWITVQTPTNIATIHCYATYFSGNPVPVVTCSPWVELYSSAAQR